MRFVDEPLPESIPGNGAVSTPMFNNTLVESGSGDEDANENWSNARHRFRLPKGIRSLDAYNDLLAHWYIMRGTARLFPFRDPMDFASVPVDCENVVPQVTWSDQQIGVGDGVTQNFQLIRTYTVGSETYERIIELPEVSTVLVSMNNADPATFLGGPYVVTVTRQGGNVRIQPAPPAGVVIRAGYLFDVPVRYEQDDTLDGINEAFRLHGFADLTLVERRLC